MKARGDDRAARGSAALGAAALRLCGRLAVGLVLSFLVPGGEARADPLPAEEAGRGAPALDSAARQALDEARALLKGARFDEAHSLARQALSRLTADFGPRSLESAAAMDLLAEVFWRSGRASSPEARETAERALRIKEEIFGPEHLEVATSMRNLACVLEAAGDTPEAGRLYRRVLALRRKLLGPDDPDVARTLIDLAGLSFGSGDYRTAIRDYEAALRILTAAYGRRHADVAMTLNNLAIALHGSGDYKGAMARYEEALSIQEEILGPESLDVAWTLTGLSELHEAEGAYSRARNLYERALAIREKRLGGDHLHVAWSLSNLAYNHVSEGDYAAARSLYERALEIQRKALGPEDRGVAKTMDDLAELLHWTGDLSGAREMYESALEIRRHTLGPGHIDLAWSQERLGLLLAEMGDPLRARYLCEAALAIREKHLGATHPEIARSLVGLAGLRATAGDREEARALYSRALGILGGSVGGEHPLVAEALRGTARLDLQEGDLAGARAAGERALRNAERSLGPQHPKVAEIRRDLALVLFAGGQSSAALDQALLAEAIGREHLILTVRTLPERQALRYAEVRSSALDLALTVAATGGIPGAGGRVWDAVVRSRALVLDEMAARMRSAGETAIGEAALLSSDLIQVTRRLAQESLRGSEAENLAAYRSRLEALRAEKERLERLLAESGASPAPSGGRKGIGLEEITRKLPAGTALVAYTLYDDLRDPGKAASRYAAFVHSSEGGEPRFVDLGPAGAVHHAVARWRAEILEHRGSREAPAGPILDAGGTAGDALRRAIWDPVARSVSGTAAVFIVPDGALHRVSFAALPDGHGAYLIESGPLFHYLSAERDVAASGDPAPLGAGLLALGGPAFDERPEEPAAALAAVRPPGSPPGSDRSGGSFRGERRACGDLRTLRFGDLPASGAEAEEVMALWRSAAPQGQAGNALYLAGPRATEAAFKEAAPGRRILHLATHGFFLDGGCPAATEETGRRGIGSLATAVSAEPQTLPTDENPLLLAGLAFAGANRRDAAAPEEEDGILTAAEIATLNLAGVEWAVLSGCDTGGGEIRPGEGVLGLRRAFQIAGARTVIMSLWPVEDRAAREWMRILYEKRLRDRLGTAEAVREASREILRRRREAGRETDPFTWGGFVAAGEWR